MDSYIDHNFFNRCTYKGFEIELKYKYPFINEQRYENIKTPFEEGKIISWDKSDIENDEKKLELRKLLLKEVFRLITNELEKCEIDTISFTLAPDYAHVYLESREYIIETSFI